MLASMSSGRSRSSWRSTAAPLVAGRRLEPRQGQVVLPIPAETADEHAQRLPLPRRVAAGRVERGDLARPAERGREVLLLQGADEAVGAADGPLDLLERPQGRGVARPLRDEVLVEPCRPDHVPVVDARAGQRPDRRERTVARAHARLEHRERLPGLAGAQLQQRQLPTSWHEDHA